MSVQGKPYRLFDDPKRFAMRPDIVIRRKTDDAIFIMDAKWKLLADNKANYGISQADMYQMYAYQKKYDAKNVTLLYPQTDRISADTKITYTSEDGVTVRVNLIDLFEIKKYMAQVLGDLQ